MEEDKKIVKEIKKEFITKMKKDITHNDNQICYRNIQALQNILNELERLQKEFEAVDHECSRLEQKETDMRFNYRFIKSEKIEMPKDYKENYREIIGNIYDNPELLKDVSSK